MLYFFLIIVAIHIGLHVCFLPTRSSIPQIIGHRGAAGLAPENSLPSIYSGIENGADYIEIDVQRTKDGMLLLLHDLTINRTTNSRGAVRKLDWVNLQKVALNNHLKGYEAKGKKIPSLVEGLEIIKNENAQVVLEIKYGRLYPNIEKQIATEIAHKNLFNQTTVISFHLRSLFEVNKWVPDVRLGYLSVYPIRLPSNIPIQVISVYWMSVLLDPTLIRRCKNKGYALWVWSVDHPLLLRLLMRVGVDGITTNRPDVLKRLVNCQKRN